MSGNEIWSEGQLRASANFKARKWCDGGICGMSFVLLSDRRLERRECKVKGSFVPVGTRGQTWAELWRDNGRVGMTEWQTWRSGDWGWGWPLVLGVWRESPTQQEWKPWRKNGLRAHFIQLFGCSVRLWEIDGVWDDMRSKSEFCLLAGHDLSQANRRPPKSKGVDKEGLLAVFVFVFVFSVHMVSFGESALQLWDFTSHLFPKSGPP